MNINEAIATKASISAAGIRPGELATCKEALHVQNVSQEDIDSLLGLRKEEASDEIERLTQENNE